jgi:hypothetical protein
LQLYNIAYNDSALSRAAILKRPKRNFAEYSNQIQSLLTKEKTQLLERVEREVIGEDEEERAMTVTHHSVNPIIVMHRNELR